MTDQPGMSKEWSQVQIPPAQTKATESLALQTPINEEINKNRDRETTTPISGPTQDPGAKRQRLNPLSEEEIIEETVDNQREERASQQTFTVRGTSASSQMQELERQRSTKVSSLKPQSKQTSDIKKTFIEIKS